MSEGFPTQAPQDATHFQKSLLACPFRRHAADVSLVSLINHVARICAALNHPKNSECWPSSSKSFGAGVAVQHRRYGVREKTSHSIVFVAPSNDLRIELSSRTTPAN